MDHKQFDDVLDAAAKELLTDAPDELLKGVMYRIERDTKPQRRFAFGRFTGFAAVAAALLIFISFRQGWTEQNDTAAPMGGQVAPTIAGSAVNESAVMNGAGFNEIQETEITGSDEDMLRVYNGTDDSGDNGVAMHMPLELTPFEIMLFDYLQSIDEEVIFIDIIKATDDALYATVEFKTRAVTLTITHEGVSSPAVQDP
jgi:hypothetical protein